MAFSDTFCRSVVRISHLVLVPRPNNPGMVQVLTPPTRWVMPMHCESSRRWRYPSPLTDPKMYSAMFGQTEFHSVSGDPMRYRFCGAAFHPHGNVPNLIESPLLFDIDGKLGIGHKSNHDKDPVTISTLILKDTASPNWTKSDHSEAVLSPSSTLPGHWPIVQFESLFRTFLGLLANKIWHLYPYGATYYSYLFR